MSTVEIGRRIALKSILFATDFSPCSNAALPYAVTIARRYGATLYPTHVMPSMGDMVFYSPESWPAAADEIELQTAEYMKRLKKNLKDISHVMLRPKGKVAETLDQMIRQYDIDLLVLGTHGRTGVSKLFMGSVAEDIFRRAACPVLSVGPRMSCQQKNAEFRNILFATDFSKESLTALPYALSLAEEDQAQILLLHVIEQPAAGIADVETVTQSLRRRLRELVPPEAEAWCQPECRVEFGRQFTSPAECILRVAAEHNCDLIVLGVRPTHGSTGVVTHLASTTAKILTKAMCPVLTVRG